MTDEASAAPHASDMRVLVVAPTRRDAEITHQALRQAGVAVTVCPTVDALVGEMQLGAAAVVITDDSLEVADRNRLASILDLQPTWSDLPFVVLARGGSVSAAVAWLQERTSVTLLERAVRLRTLISAVQMAVRGRRRQYQIRDLLITERQARIDADSANAAKDRFLAVLSHELRTPLTPIVFAVASLQKSLPESAPERRVVDMIGRNVSLETKLIDDLLDLSRVVQGKLQLQKNTVDLHDKIRDTLAMVESDARAKGITVNVGLSANAHKSLADPARIQQILWNLLKNALKFTEPGGTVTVTTWNERGDFCLSCADDGIGIAPDVLPLVFEPFQQGGAEITRHYGGLGLGLAVSRSLTEAHGGSLKATSPGAGEGATFTLRMPLARESLRDGGGLSGHDSRGRHDRRINVLLVEDHADTAIALNEALTALGHRVRVVHSIADALRAAAAEPVELLISDIGLPDGSGLDLMRQMAPRPSIGAIALSGFGMDQDLKRSADAGFNRHLTKPVDARQLEYAIAEIERDSVSSALRRG